MPTSSSRCTPTPSPTASVSGASVYVLSEHGATNEAARWLAERENSADLMGGVPLDGQGRAVHSVLLDLTQTREHQRQHRRRRARGRCAGRRRRGAQAARCNRPASWCSSRRAIPSMLVETAYISNPQEERRLRTQRAAGALADAIFSGMRSYFAAEPTCRHALRAAAPRTLASASTPEQRRSLALIRAVHSAAPSPAVHCVGHAHPRTCPANSLTRLPPAR